jgi:outer membrane protein, heavy metal efflux system
MTGVIVLFAACQVMVQIQQPVPPAAGRFIDPAGGITLDEAVARALAEEPSLRAARAGILEAEGLRVQAALRPNPMVSFMQQEETGGPDRQTRLDLQWPLDLWRRGPRVAVAEREVEAVRLRVADRERVRAAEVRMAYGDVAAAAEQLAVLTDLAAAAREQHATLEARVKEGADRPLDRDMLRVEAGRMEADAVRQEARAEEALIRLKRLLGLPPNAALRIRDTLERLVEEEHARSVPDGAGVLESRPDIREAQARVAAADAHIDRARSEGRADVSLVGMYMRMDSGFMLRGLTDSGMFAPIRGVFHNLGAGAMVTVPIRNRNQGAVAAAEARRTAAAAEVDAARLTAGAEVAQALARDRLAHRAVEIFRTDARAVAARNLAVVRESFTLGKGTIFDVVAEQRRYLETELAYVMALREAFEARQALRLATGETR